MQEWFGYNMNEYQQAAIWNSIHNRVSFIKGPPGCGKTKLISRMCSIFAYHGFKVLTGTVSNTANLSIADSLLRECEEIGFDSNIVLFIPKELSRDNILLPPQIRRLTFRQKIIQNYI